MKKSSQNQLAQSVVPAQDEVRAIREAMDRAADGSVTRLAAQIQQARKASRRRFRAATTSH